MNKSLIIKAAITFTVFAALCFSAFAEKLVILHTNDTHSQVDPTSKGLGGIIQRKAIMDSVRRAEKNVITVDAGDAVQGTLYFNYFRGDVEYPLMNMAGYDIRILGNHEFDNGMADLAVRYKNVEGTPLSANYDFTGTELEGVFRPYVIKEIDGKKIGFFGINIDPTSIISEKNINVKFKDIIPTSNETAAYLKNNENCDVVVAVTHIGYEKSNEKTTDVELAENSKDIDIIIGGHSHTLIDPSNPEKFPSLINNSEGKPVRVVQLGKQGLYLGKLSLDLDKFPDGNGGDVDYELITVADRFPEESLDKEMLAFIQPYKEKVDSIYNVVIAQSAYDMTNSRTGGMANMTADFGLHYANQIADSLRNAGINIPRVDLAVMNVGGIRHSMPKGNITEGQILSTYPFSNRFVIISLNGSDIYEAMKVAAAKGGEAVSENVRIVTDWNGNIVRMIVDGEEIDPSKKYLVGTIDYVAEGNDDMVTFANHEKVWIDSVEVSIPIMKWVKKQTELGLEVNPDPRSRFVVESTLVSH